MVGVEDRAGNLESRSKDDGPLATHAVLCILHLTLAWMHLCATQEMR